MSADGVQNDHSGDFLYPMDIKQATVAYEDWLKIPLIAADLKLKHQHMAESSFQFLRATFYRWSQLWPEICPELNRGKRPSSMIGNNGA
jgi:hypothetical protein